MAQNKLQFLLLVLILIFASLYFILSHEGLYYSDDIGYSEFAGRIINGTFDITQNGHTFIHRPTVFLPTALFYSVFGVNFITYSLWPYICTIGCLLITYKAAQQNLLSPIFAVVFLGFTFYFLYFINFLYPDNIVAFFTLASAAIYHNVKNKNSSKLLLKALTFTVCLFLAGLAKETAVIFMPFFVYLAIKDLINKASYSSFWLYVATIGSILLIAYFGWYYMETGNAFYRISEMEKANLRYANYVTDPTKSYVKRLLLAPFTALIGTGSFIIVVFAVGGKSLLSKTNQTHKNYWITIFIVTYIILCFSSTSLKTYNPITLDARMFNLVLPPLAIAASYGFTKKLLKPLYTLSYAIVFASIAVFLQNKVGAIYGLLSLYFIVHTAWIYFSNAKKLVIRCTGLAAITVCLAIRPVYFMIKSKTLYYKEHQLLFSELKRISKLNKHTEVIIPQYIYNCVNYFNGYSKDVSLTFNNYQNIDDSHGADKILMINRKLNSNSSFTENAPYQHIIKAINPEKLIWKNGPLELYQL